MKLIYIFSQIKIKLAQDLVATLLNSGTAMLVSCLWLVCLQKCDDFPDMTAFVPSICSHLASQHNEDN